MNPPLTIAASLWLALLPALAHAGEVPSWTAQRWKSRFVTQWQSDRATFSSWSRSGDADHHYFLHTAFDAATTGYLVTGEALYVEAALTWVEAMIATARANESDGYLGWVERGAGRGAFIGGQGPGRESTLCDSNVFREVTRLLHVIRTTPALFDAYRDRYDAVRRFTEKHVFQKWWSRTGWGVHGYVLNASVTNMQALWGQIAFDLWLLPDGDPAWRAKYHEAWRTIAGRVRRSFYRTGDDPVSHAISARIGAGASSPLDSDHVNQTLSLIVEMYEHGQYWTAQDIQGLANQIKRKMWTGAGFAPWFDGSTRGLRSSNLLNLQSAVARFGRYDRGVQAILERFAASGGTWLSSAYYATGALNALRWAAARRP